MCLIIAPHKEKKKKKMLYLFRIKRFELKTEKQQKTVELFYLERSKFQPILFSLVK